MATLRSLSGRKPLPPPVPRVVPARAVPERPRSGRCQAAARLAGVSRGSMGNPPARQASNPPARGRTRVTPTRRSRSATRALVASLGQEQ
jgi:hypothetical protein